MCVWGGGDFKNFELGDTLWFCFKNRFLPPYGLRSQLDVFIPTKLNISAKTSEQGRVSKSPLETVIALLQVCVSSSVFLDNC